MNNFQHLKEFQNGIIGKNVWRHILTEAGILKKDIDTLLKKIPPTEKLQSIPRNNDEIIGYFPSSINGSFLNIKFWEEKFKFKFYNNASVCGFSWDEYSQKKLNSEGVFVVSKEGVGHGEVLSDQIKKLPNGYVIANTGVQLSINAIGYILGFGFINENRIIRCTCDTLGVSAVGGIQSTKTICVLKDAPALANKRAALGCCKKIL